MSSLRKEIKERKREGLRKGIKERKKGVKKEDKRNILRLID